MDCQVSNGLRSCCTFYPAELCAQLPLFCSQSSKETHHGENFRCTNSCACSWMYKPFFFFSLRCQASCYCIPSLFFFYTRGGMQQKMQKYSKYNHKGDAMAQYCACFLKQLRVPSAFCWLAVCGCHLLVKVLHGLFLLLDEDKSTEVRFFYYFFFFF